MVGVRTVDTFGHQHLDGTADQVAAAPAEQRLGLTVGQPDDTAGVDDDDAVGRGLDQLLEEVGVEPGVHLELGQDAAVDALGRIRSACDIAGFLSHHCPLVPDTARPPETLRLKTLTPAPFRYKWWAEDLTTCLNVCHEPINRLQREYRRALRGRTSGPIALSKQWYDHAARVVLLTISQAQVK